MACFVCKPTTQNLGEHGGKTYSYCEKCGALQEAGDSYTTQSATRLAEEVCRAYYRSKGVLPSPEDWRDVLECVGLEPKEPP